MPIIDKLIKTAPKGTTGIEVMKKDTKTNFNYLYNTAMIDGNLYGIKIDLRKTSSGDVFYVHRINILKEDLQNTVTGVRSSSEVNLKSSTNNSISQKTESVKSDKTVINKDMQKKENNTNIQDFGEKIGGARKDTAMPRGTQKIAKEVIHDYTVKNTENGYSVDFKGSCNSLLYFDII